MTRDGDLRAIEREQFLAMALPAKAVGESYFLGVHTPSTHGSDARFEQHRFEDGEALARCLAAQADAGACYVALATFTGKRREKRAVMRRHILSVDIDDKCLGSAERAHGHVLEIARSIPGPMIVVDTGYGAHVHLRVPHDRDVEPGCGDDRGIPSFEAMGLALRRYVESQIQSRYGIATKLDSTHTAERVWRVPGTWNCKTGSGSKVLTSDRSLWREVRLVTPLDQGPELPQNDLKFLDRFLNEPRRERNPAKPGKFDIGLLSPALTATWPMANGDQSRHDFAVARSLLKNGHSTFVAYDALVARRTALPRSSDRSKGARQDYLRATIEAAQKSLEDRRRTRTWPQLSNAVKHGLAGEFLRLVDPHTEADPAALLFQFLSGFGNIIGRGPHFRVENDTHYAKLNAVCVGETSKGRKGTSSGRVQAVFKVVDEGWVRDCVTDGLSSGEGLIWTVRDPIFKDVPIRKKGKIVGNQKQLVDEGVSDKRLFIIEGEFASTLKVMGREGNTLSALIRNAWDRGDLRSLTKNSPARATGSHISIVGHITTTECLRLLTKTEAANGFGNRFLWVCVRRSKVLPEGGNLDPDVIREFASRVREVANWARAYGEVRKTDAAGRLWAEVYEELSSGKPGLLGALIGRAEAQVMRLALVYALLDKSEFIDEEHLRAALAAWQYCEDSARYIFGENLGDNVADRLLTLLRDHPGGLTRTEIRDAFGRKHATRITAALDTLHAHRLARSEEEDTGGRPVTRWFLAEPKGDKSDISDQSPPRHDDDETSVASVAFVATESRVSHDGDEGYEEEVF